VHASGLNNLPTAAQAAGVSDQSIAARSADSAARSANRASRKSVKCAQYWFERVKHVPTQGALSDDAV